MVRVDYEVRGCPIDRTEFLESLRSLLAGSGSNLFEAEYLRVVQRSLDTAGTLLGYSYHTRHIQMHQAGCLLEAHPLRHAVCAQAYDSLGL